MESKGRKVVAVVILNWNNWKYTVGCLESLYRIDYPCYGIIIVDNGSTDDSIKRLRELFRRMSKGKSKTSEYDPRKKPTGIIEYKRREIEDTTNNNIDEGPPSYASRILIRNEKNYGFAEGNNIGIRYALHWWKSDFVLLLNNDTVVDPEFLKELVRTASSQYEIGIVGPKIHYYDFSGRNDVIHFAGEDLIMWKAESIRYGFNQIDRGQCDDIREVDKIDGACILIKSEVFRDIGLLDPEFFIYWEETDFCKRASRKGYKIVYVPRAKLWHKVTATMGGKLGSRFVYLMTRNTFRFMKKNASFKERLGFLLYFFLFRLWINGATYLFYHRNLKAFLSFVKGVKEGVGQL